MQEDNGMTNGPSLRELKAKPEPEKLTETSTATAVVTSAKYSPYELYQMALPQIMNSNSRVQQLISIERRKQKKVYIDRIKNYLAKHKELSEKVPYLGEDSLTAYERYVGIKREAFEKNFLKGIKESVRSRYKLGKVKQSIEKLSLESIIESENGSKKAKKVKEGKDSASSSGKKSSKKNISSTNAAVNDPSAMTVQEEETFSVSGLSEDEARAALWKHIARKQIPKLARLIHQGTSSRLFNSKKLAQAAAGLIKRQNSRLAGKPVTAARRAMKEMLAFWKRNEREERDLRKKAEKEAAERRKIEEEQREARRQAKKLNFLITQTELYSHFVGRKQQGTGTATATATSTSNSNSHSHASTLSKDTDFADVDDSVIQAEAERIAKNAAAAHQAKLEQFQTTTGGPTTKSDNDDMDFMNPSTLKDATILEQPTLMQVTLKSYQLKGLTWLASLYEQGINGILADEMGLGKTIQSISLLAHLAERQNNWGPFLIVTPASTLHNWQQEFARFVPALKIIPYWGSVQDRKVLRSTCMPFWTGKKQVTRDTPFHVMITSYQLIVSDETYLQKVKWQYMILDEAQAIKSSSSIRWKTLLGFNCRNRLLLTGTPIQNSMQELWALLHFIMPTLFDSHDEFSEWFSKDIESHAENRGSGLNSHQLHRLHMILKPFMLRRVKADVENEMGEKVEKDVFCDLSPRQKRLYRGIKDKLPILDLITSGSTGSANQSGKFNFGFGIGGSGGDSSSSAIDSALMNLVMQFRKVCNHPELLEKTEILSPFSFTTPERLSGTSSNYGVLFTNPSAIEFRLPKRIIEEIPIGSSKRILLEISNNSDFKDKNWKYEKLQLIPSKGNNNNDIILPSMDTCKFLEDRLPLAAPIKVISKGPSVFPVSVKTDDIILDGQDEDLMIAPLHKSIAIPSMEKFIRDCGKLSKLDSLLVELKAGGHRVLIYNQMTRMIDLMEEYLQYRGYSYLRLDGSTNIATRRDLVHSWQTDSSIFVFLLSTRAGGLGINLTAADTVIFYDSDWNPTVDQQAMDRAHRLGQMKQVTVYRLITKNTVEERIMQRAKQKDQIHKVVIAGGAFKGVAGASNGTEAIESSDGKPKDRKEIMSLLLVDEE